MAIKFSLLFYLILLAYSNDFYFYYHNPEDKLYITSEDNYNTTNGTAFLQTKLLKQENLKKQYYSSADNSKFDIKYYECNISSLSNKTLELIKVEYNLTEPEDSRMTEVLLNLDILSENVYPRKYKDEFFISQNNKGANKARIKRDTIIYDTFCFNIESKNKLNFKIVKILLVNFRKDKLNYLANLSYNVHKGTNNVFDIYLKNLPEDFDLLVTLDVYNKYNNKSEKVLLVRKNFEYPNYRIDESNPNKTMIIISITFICIAFILILIFVLLKIIFGFF